MSSSWTSLITIVSFFSLSFSRRSFITVISTRLTTFDFFKGDLIIPGSKEEFDGFNFRMEGFRIGEIASVVDRIFSCPASSSSVSISTSELSKSNLNEVFGSSVCSESEMIFSSVFARALLGYYSLTGWNSS